MTIDLPGGSTFTAKAFGVAVAAPPGPGSAQEWEIVVNSSVHSMAELAAEMRRVQPILHLDKGKVDGYVTSADKGRAGQLVLTGGQFGYVKTSAEPRPTGYADDNIAINYTFHWPAQPGTSAS